MPTTTSKKGMTLGMRNTLVGLSFILPNFTGFTIFILIPVLFSFYLGFCSWDGFNDIIFIGGGNFETIFNDATFIACLKQTLHFTIFSVILGMGFSLLMAMILNRKLRGLTFFRSAIFFPYVASIVAVAAVWKAMFMKDGGPINAMLQMLGVPYDYLPGWFVSTDTAMWAVIIVQVWRQAGYFMVIYLAALQNIPYHLYEAAEIEGASGWTQFIRITVPMLTPSHFFVFMMLTINCFKAFDLIFLLTNGGPGTATKVLTAYVYDKAFVSWNYGEASAAAMIMFLVVGSITIFQFAVEKKINDFA